MRQGWNVLEPANRPFVDNWHIGAITEHLEAVSRGEIRNLLINISPGTMKTLTAVVFWPAWEWGPLGMPWTRWLCASYSAELSTRDARRCRVLIDSAWYQERWGHVFGFAPDQNQKQRYENTKSGFRIATGITGLGTGERVDRIVFDDPHNVRQSLSSVQIREAIVWWDETASTRPVDPSTSAFVGIMQRLAEGDLSGHWLEQGDVTHLCLPMEFEPDRRCYTWVRPRSHVGQPDDKVKGYCWDPRTEPGELMFPQRFPADALAAMKKKLGIYGVSGQFQQRPAPRGGGMFDVTKIEVIAAAPSVRRRVRFWDLAGTKEAPGIEPAYTAGVLMSVDADDTYYIEDVTRFRDTPAGVEKRMKAIASQDGPKVRVGIPKDPGQAGVMQSQYLVGKLAPHRVSVVHETGDKETRAEALASQVGAGNVKLIRGEWNGAFIDEAANFPVGRFKDQIDAAANAFHLLAVPEPRMVTGRLEGH